MLVILNLSKKKSRKKIEAEEHETDSDTAASTPLKNEDVSKFEALIAKTITEKRAKKIGKLFDEYAPEIWSPYSRLVEESNDDLIKYKKLVDHYLICQMDDKSDQKNKDKILELMIRLNVKEDEEEEEEIAS